MIFSSGYERIWTDGPVLNHINWMTDKTEWVEHTFVHYCAMIMLNGGGRVFVEDRETYAEAPFVLLARPGWSYRYGPDNSWDEYGFVFKQAPSPDALAQFPEMPWPVKAPDLLQEQLAQFERLLDHPAAPGVLDQLDLLARSMLTSTRYGTGEDVARGPLRQLYAAEAWLRKHFTDDFVLNEVAERFGFSPTTFRRKWRKQFPLSPWQYVLDLRLQEAERLLRNTGLTIGEIADHCGFSDQRYFATLFRQKTGRTPGAARRGQ